MAKWDALEDGEFEFFDEQRKFPITVHSIPSGFGHATQRRY